MMRRSAGFDANEARRQLLKEWQNVSALELTTNDYITCRVNSVDLKTDLAISRPMVVTACMFGSSESWGPQQHPRPWHFRAGGGAVHSIKSGLTHCSKISLFDYLVGATNFQWIALLVTRLCGVSPRRKRSARFPRRCSQSDYPVIGG